MNRDKYKLKGDYNRLQTSIFLKTLIIMFATVVFSVIIPFIIYSLFLQGRFSDIVVNFLQYFIFKDYDTALNVYDQVFREKVEWFMALSVLAIFLIALRLYLRSFTKYFNEINRGIDALIEENTGNVTLSPELAAVEKKINYIKHTLKQRQVATEAAEQRKSDLVVYLAHDLKTPLTSVIGYLTLLRDEGQISEELRKKYLSISLQKAEHLEDLINEFFEITRFNCTGITPEYSNVNLTRLLEQLTYEFKPMLLEKNLQCILKIAPDTMIKCDVNKIQRVFDNLLKNAVNYSFNNAPIHITASQDKNNIRITFTNCGNTIPKEKLQRIFEQFYRLDAARSSGSGGAGLGLAIAKEIVDLHHGTITAKSQDEMVEFEVTLPNS